jgi:predicted nucleic acid-binding protein
LKTNNIAARYRKVIYGQLLISPVTWMEVMAGQAVGEEEMLRKFLARFRQIDIDQEVAEYAVAIRRKHKIRLPDAIIWASAKKENALLVSRNHKDFPADDPGIRMPYSV